MSCSRFRINPRTNIVFVVVVNTQCQMGSAKTLLRLNVGVCVRTLHPLISPLYTSLRLDVDIERSPGLGEALKMILRLNVDVCVSLGQLGAHVILTDREEDPWVINNIRGTATANGLPPVCPLSEGVDTTHSSEGREVIYERKGWPGDLGDDAAARDHSSTGSCCVHELFWGNVAPAAIDLATAHPRPQVLYRGISHSFHFKFQGPVLPEQKLAAL